MREINQVCDFLCNLGVFTSNYPHFGSLFIVQFYDLAVRSVEGRESFSLVHGFWCSYKGRRKVGELQSIYKIDYKKYGDHR